MGGVDVDLFFTNISLEETIDIYANTIFEHNERVESLSKMKFKELLSLTSKES